MVRGVLIPKLGKTGLCDDGELSAYTNKHHLFENSRHVAMIVKRDVEKSKN